MDVPGLGTGPAEADFLVALRALAGSKGRGLTALQGAGDAQPGDSVGAILRQLSAPAALKLLEILEHPPLPEVAARLDGLLGASISAVSEEKPQQALAQLAEFAALDPRRAEALASEPGLASIRPEVGQLLSRLASAARFDAESRLSRAAELLEASGSREIPGRELSTEIAIVVAGRLLEAGGYVNAVRSSEFSQMAINEYGFAPAPAPPAASKPKHTPPMTAEPTVPSARRRWASWIRNLWLRAPLLVLLLAWLALGLAGGAVAAVWRGLRPQTLPETLVEAGFDVWGIGFLALIGFGFYVRVRRWLR